MACEYLPSEYATLSNFPSGTWSRDNAKGGEAEDASIHTGMGRKPASQPAIHPLIIRSNITNSSPAEFLYTIRREMSRHDMALVAVPWVQLVLLLPILMLMLLLSPCGMTASLELHLLLLRLYTRMCLACAKLNSSSYDDVRGRFAGGGGWERVSRLILGFFIELVNDATRRFSALNWNVQ